jgi:hypothetical protein
VSSQFELGALASRGIGGTDAAGIPWAERAAAVVLSPKTFVALLLFATLIPYFIGALTIFNLVSVTWIISFIVFLATVHVPMTAYLLSDREIRVQIAHRRLIMIGGCVFLIALSMFVFTAFSATLGSQHSEIVYLFAIAGVMWQHWHFGKQNLGVLALSRIATRTGPVVPFERYTVVGGAICGIAAAYLMVGKTFQSTYSPDGNLGLFMSPMEVISTQFRWFQYLLAAAAFGYTAYNFRRFTPSTAALYLAGVCFFLPQFLSIDLPQYVYIFGSFISAHGTQYMVILFYHSLGSIDLIRRSDDNKQSTDGLHSDRDRQEIVRRITRAVRLLSPLIFFGLTMVAAINFHTSHSLLGYGNVIGRITNNLMSLHLTGPTVGGLTAGFIWGLLLCHFWLDSFFWRLKEKAPREWIRSRYAFLFARSRN